jgi:hypothetical protein
MARSSNSENYPYEPEEKPILEAWPEFWWLNERDRSNAFEARARAYGGEGYRGRSRED